MSLFAAISVTQRGARGWFCRAGCTAYVLALCCMLWACESSAPQRTLESIQPNIVSNDTETVVKLKGTGFLRIPRVVLGSRSRAAVASLYVLRVGDVFTTDVVKRRSDTELQFTLPAGLTPGTYDVALRPHGAPELVLDDALTIKAPETIKVPELRFSLEDAPGGEGKALPAVLDKKTGEQLSCYAVLRDSSGTFVRDAPATWNVMGVISSSLTDATSLDLSFTSPGKTTIEAQYLANDPVSLEVNVAPRLQRLKFEPNTATRAAGASALTFRVVGEDDAGNITDDVGELTYSVIDGVLPDLDLATLTLMPRRVSAGHLAVQSSYGVSATSDLIEVATGPLAKLKVSPDSLQLSADDQAVQFTVKGSDAFDNPIDNLGTLTWSVTKSTGRGPIGTVTDQGLFDPTTAGTGIVHVTSSLGPEGDSGNIDVVAGKLVGISIQPQTWIGLVGDAPQQFLVTGADAEGNPIVTDVGTLTFGIGSGEIAAIDAQTGLFTPTTPGQGTISVSSSLGYTTTTQNVVVSPKGATLRISKINAPTFVWAGEHGARIDVEITSTDPGEVVWSGLALSFGSLRGDQTSAFTVYPDSANVERVPAGGTQTLIYYLDVASSLSSLTSLTISATGEAFPQFKAPFVFAGSVSISTRIALTDSNLVVTAPVPPANRICAGGRVMFGAEANHLLSVGYEWHLPGATLAPNSSASSALTAADYAAVGSYQNSVTSSYFGYPNTLFGVPIYVGNTASVATDEYPTGPVVFTAPAAGQAIALSSFPRSDLIALSPSLPLRQCNSSVVSASGHRALTLFSDRGLVSSAADVDQAAPGIQVLLGTDGLLSGVPLVAPKTMLEGSSTLYLEYLEPNTNVVTAAGDTTFKLSADTQAPSVQWSMPSVDCSSACLAPGDALLFQFSEPMDTANLSNVKVELLADTSCSSSVASNLTSSSDRSYESTRDLLYVKPPARSGSYAVRVTLPASVTDAASGRNPLPASTRCAVFGALAAVSDPATPQLTAVASTKLSPDGDTVSDTVTWKVSADAATSYLRLRVTRLSRVVWARLSPVTQAGEYTFVWDGADASGRILSDGVYGYAIEAVNRAGKASAALRGYVEIDSAVHMVSLRSPQ